MDKNQLLSDGADKIRKLRRLGVKVEDFDQFIIADKSNLEILRRNIAEMKSDISARAWAAHSQVSADQTQGIDPFVTPWAVLAEATLKARPVQLVARLFFDRGYYA